jgi:hypothetical protein
MNSTIKLHFLKIEMEFFLRISKKLIIQIKELLIIWGSKNRHFSTKLDNL